MFSPLDIIAQNIHMMGERISKLENDMVVATVPVTSTSAAVATAATVAAATASPIPNQIESVVKQGPTMAEFESKIKKLTMDIHNAAKSIETVMIMKLEAQIVKLEERIFSKIDNKIKVALATEAILTANAITSAIALALASVPVPATVAIPVSVVTTEHLSLVEQTSPSPSEPIDCIDRDQVLSLSTQETSHSTLDAHSNSDSFEIEFKAKKPHGKKKQ
jgi:hypothetical protein